jgi:hypothetical protein
MHYTYHRFIHHCIGTMGPNLYCGCHGYFHTHWLSHYRIRNSSTVNDNNENLFKKLSLNLELNIQKILVYRSLFTSLFYNFHTKHARQRARGRYYEMYRYTQLQTKLTVSQICKISFYPSSLLDIYVNCSTNLLIMVTY